MYIYNTKNIEYSFGKTEKISAILKEARIKRESYEQKYRPEPNWIDTEKFRMEDKYTTYEKMRALSPTEVYFNHINSNRELIYAVSINDHPAYKTTEETLGKNIDIII